MAASIRGGQPGFHSVGDGWQFGCVEWHLTRDEWRRMLAPPFSQPPARKPAMTLCPIAIVASCAKCPAFKVCPLKTVIGDVPKTPPAKTTKSRKK